MEHLDVVHAAFNDELHKIANTFSMPGKEEMARFAKEQKAFPPKNPLLDAFNKGKEAIKPVVKKASLEEKNAEAIKEALGGNIYGQGGAATPEAQMAAVPPQISQTGQLGRKNMIQAAGPNADLSKYMHNQSMLTNTQPLAQAAAKPVGAIASTVTKAAPVATSPGFLSGLAAKAKGMFGSGAGKLVPALAGAR